MLKLGEAHRALSYVSRFLCARGAPAPALTAALPGEPAAFTPAGAKAPLHEFDAMVCALASGASPALLGGSALERSEVVECLNVFQAGGVGVLHVLEARLALRSYVAGARLSVADALAVYAAVPALRDLPPAQLVQDYPETARWLDQLGHEAPQLYTVGGEGAPARLPLPPFPTLQAVLAACEAAEAAGSSGAAAKPPAAEGGGGGAKKEKKAGGGGGGGGAAAAPPPPAEERSALSEMDFGVGRIVEAWPHPESDKLWCEKIAFGSGEAVREIASGLRAYFTQEQMVGQRVVVVRNLKSRKLAGFASNGMVLCATTAEGKVEFVEPPEGAALGERVSFEGHAGAAAEPTRVEKKKVRVGRGGAPNAHMHTQRAPSSLPTPLCTSLPHTLTPPPSTAIGRSSLRP
jgi:aminoacyl tRNA synthase complex-interacting multifunctional protein 1